MKNEFEYDWCASALDGVKNDLAEMKKARWLFFAQKADPFLEACVRFLHYADQCLKLGFSLEIIVGDEEFDAAAGMFPFATVRSIDRQDAPIEAEFCVCWGYSQGIDEVALRHMAKFWQRIARPVRRGVYISSSAVYGEYPYPVAAAEGEFLKANTQPARAAEMLVSQSQSSFVILRPGTVLAAWLPMESAVTRLLDRLMKNEDIGQISARTKYSLVYITDFLTAWIKTVAAPKACGIYNVSSTEETVSLLRICEAYLESTEDHRQIRVNLENSGVCPSFALDGAKLKALGWRRKVDLNTMLAMEIGARNGTGADLYFTGGHQGKRSAIQSCLFHMLCEIDRICKKHDIGYFLAGGTLLGAVRHQGFIPWDDDLDVMMLRRDYERFLAIAQEELPAQLFLQTPATEPGNHYLISKIRLNDTVFSSAFLLRFPELHNGIFVDVIAQDHTANSSWGQKLHLKLSLLARGLVFRKWSCQSAAEKGRGWLAVDAVTRVLPFRVLEWFQKKVLTMFARLPNRKYLYDSMGVNISRGAYPAEWLSEQVTVTFEGREFPAPAAYDRYLRYLYGEYMRPVPITQRVSSHWVPRVDLGPFAENPDQERGRQER